MAWLAGQTAIGPPRHPRVLQVVLSLNPGGTERLVVELAGRLDEEIPMMVCCLDDAGAWAHDLEARGIEVLALARLPGFRPSLGWAIARAARRHGATLVHAHHYSPFVYGCLARLWHPTLQVVFTEHGRVSDAPPSAKRRAANWVLARIPRRVFAVSGDLKRHLVAEGFADEAVGVIYNGIGTGPLPDAAARAEVRQSLAVTEGTLVLGTIARLDPVKDLGGLVRATSVLSHDLDVTLVIVGDGPERPSLEGLARELGVESRVRFLGHRDDARQWLAGFDIYVNCSVSEGVSLTILEAMAAGLPVVATRVGGTPEVLDDSCGRLVAARDPEVLAAALLDLARQPQVRVDLGRAAWHRVETRFTIERMVSEYRDVYRGQL